MLQLVTFCLLIECFAHTVSEGRRSLNQIFRSIKHFDIWNWSRVVPGCQKPEFFQKQFWFVTIFDRLVVTHTQIEMLEGVRFIVRKQSLVIAFYVLTVGSVSMDVSGWHAVKRQRQDSDHPQSGTVKTIGVNQIRFHCCKSLDDALIALCKVLGAVAFDWSSISGCH